MIAHNLDAIIEDKAAHLAARLFDSDAMEERKAICAKALRDVVAAALPSDVIVAGTIADFEAALAVYGYDGETVTLDVSLVQGDVPDKVGFVRAGEAYLADVTMREYAGRKLADCHSRRLF